MLNGTTTATYGGKMYWPVPAVRQLSRGFSQGHKALDIWGPGILKKPIYAAADGVVVKSVKMHYSYGNYVMIDHGLDKQGRRIMTLYAHMYAAPNVSVGQQVVGGQTQLGLVGNTGNSFGAHLHFEVRENGTHVDPIAKGYVVKPT
jgi:murein DD-endopeptidase MepM/ murein hydrolase activator NlpD